MNSFPSDRCVCGVDSTQLTYHSFSRHPPTRSYSHGTAKLQLSPLVGGIGDETPVLTCGRFSVAPSGAVAQGTVGKDAFGTGTAGVSSPWNTKSATPAGVGRIREERVLPGNGFQGPGRFPPTFPASPSITCRQQKVSETSRGAAGVSSVGANTTYA